MKYNMFLSKKKRNSRIVSTRCRAAARDGGTSLIMHMDVGWALNSGISQFSLVQRHESELRLKAYQG
jgi:hypothetical protein